MVKIKMNKKGWIKTLEAVIAIILIMGFILIITPKHEIGEEIPENVKVAQEFILEEVLYNETFRNCVINAKTGSCKKDGGCKEDLNNFIAENVPAGYDYECEICISGSCIALPTETLEKSVYVNNVFIAEGPRIFRIYFWRK